MTQQVGGFIFPRFTGHIRIETIEDDECVSVFEQDNIIPNETLKDLLSSLNAVFASKRISLSNSTMTVAYDVYQIPSILATGRVPTGTPDNGITFFADAEPIYGEILNEVLYPTYEEDTWSREFKVVALTTLSTDEDHVPAPTNTRAYAYLQADDIQVQSYGQILRIYYQIQFPIQGVGVKDWVRKELAQLLFGVYGSGSFFSELSFEHIYTTGLAPCEFEYDNFFLTNLAIHGISSVSLDQGGSSTRSFVASSDLTLLRRNYSAVYYEGNLYHLGAIVHALFIGLAQDTNRVYSHNQMEYNEYPFEPFQTGFWHSAVATTPFFDSGSDGISLGTITLGGTWTKFFPEMLRVEITGVSGEIGVASYRFSVKKHTGFEGNSYTSRSISVPWRNKLMTPHPNVHGWQDNGFPVLRWNETTVVQFDETGITFLNIWDGVYTTYDAASTPSMAATEITQVALDQANSKIYVACRETGIWEITVTVPGMAGTVIHPITGATYGIARGYDRIWAVIEGRLSSSLTGFLEGEPITYTGLTDGNWSKCTYLKADVLSNENRLAIVINTTGSTYQVIWWDAITDVAVTGYASSALSKSVSLNVCPEEVNFWVCANSSNKAVKLTYGSSANSLLGVASSATGYTLQGTTAVGYIVEFYKTKLIGLTVTLGSNGVTDFVPSYGSSGGSTLVALTHLENGICLISKSTQDVSLIRQIFSGQNDAWQSYGWDGDSWELGNTSGKLTHNDVQALVNGITVTFVNGTTVTPGFFSFVLGEYITQSVNWGLLKDNATQFGIGWFWSTKGVIDDSFT